MLHLSSSTRSFIVFVALLIVTIGIGKWITHRSLAAQASDALVIDIAGKQRMLSQRILAYSALLYLENSTSDCREELAKVVQEWQTAHKDLLEGNIDRGIPLQHLAHRQSLAELTPLIDLSVQDVEALMRQEEVNFARFQSNINTYLVEMNAAVAELVRASNEKAKHAQLISLLVTGALLVILFSVVIFVLRPYHEKNASLIKALKIQDQKMHRQVRDLKEANEGLNQFMYVASHDMKTPLRSIGSFAALIQRRYAEQIPDEAYEYFEFIKKNATAMSQVLDDLVAFNRAGEKRKTEVIDLDKIISQIKLNLAADISQNEVILTADRLGKAKGSKVVVSQILQNLILNAIVYRDYKRVCRIKVTRQDTAGGSILVVKDNGVGLDNAFIDKVFLPFQRVGELDRPGSGIGLAICRKMARSMGGDITYRGKIGVGTSFYVGLDCVPEFVEEKTLETV